MDRERLHLDPERSHAIQKAFQVALHAGADHGVERGRREPLEFPELGQHLARHAEVHAGQQALQCRACTPFVRLKIAQRSETVIALPEAWAVSPTEDLLTRGGMKVLRQFFEEQMPSR